MNPESLIVLVLGLQPCRQIPVQLDDVEASGGTIVAGWGRPQIVSWNGEIAVGETVEMSIGAVRLGRDFAVRIQGEISFDADNNGLNESMVLTDDPRKPGAADPTVWRED